MHRRAHLTQLAALLLAGGLPLGNAHAQRQYPSKPIRFLVGFPPGQATDTVARMIAERMAQKLGQPIVVENKPGQGGSAVMSYLMQQPNDGYAVTLSATGAVLTNLYLQKNLPYGLDDFTPVSLIGDLPLVLVARPDMPFNDLEGMLAYAKANPGRLSYASPGNGTTAHLTMESIKKESGARIVHIPYQGSARAIADLMGGQTDVAFDTMPVTIPHVQAGKLKLLAVGHSRRLSAFPQGRPARESGFPNVTASVWIGMFGPKGMPANVTDTLNQTLVDVIREQEMTRKLESLGLFVRTFTPSDFGKFLKAEAPRWKQAVVNSGATVD